MEDGVPRFAGVAPFLSYGEARARRWAPASVYSHGSVLVALVARWKAIALEWTRWW